jgi:hypothetical protein
MNQLHLINLRAVLLVLATLVWASVPAAVSAEELIHFDCVTDGSEVTPDRPHTDLSNDPPNNLQCLAGGASVLGQGTVHPHLEIKSPGGHSVVKNQTAVSTGATFYAPNDYKTKSNCFEFLDQPRKEVAAHQTFGAWGFGDTTVCGGENCGKAVEPVALDFAFHDITVEEFSIRMLDWGDYRPGVKNPDNFQVLLTAYNAANSVVDTYNYHFTVSEVGLGSDTYKAHTAYACASEVNNTCYGGGDDLWSQGDACVANEGEPGYLTLTVEGPGITRLELRMPSHGRDPNVGFDSIRFNVE